MMSRAIRYFRIVLELCIPGHTCPHKNIHPGKIIGYNGDIDITSRLEWAGAG